MTFFTKDEFVAKYPERNNFEDWKIEGACEKIYEQIGLAKRGMWDLTNVPDAVKRASMEQLRFMLEYDIPFIDYKGKVKAGEMESELNTPISTNLLAPSPVISAKLISSFLHNSLIFSTTSSPFSNLNTYLSSNFLYSIFILPFFKAYFIA